MIRSTTPFEALIGALWIDRAGRQTDRPKPLLIPQPLSRELLAVLTSGLEQTLRDPELFDRVFAIYLGYPGPDPELEAPLPSLLHEKVTTDGVAALTADELVLLATRPTWIAQVADHLRATTTRTSIPKRTADFDPPTIPSALAGRNQAAPAIGTEPLQTTKPWSLRLRRMVGFALPGGIGALIAAVFMGAIVIGSRPQPAQAEEDKKTATRKQEEGRKDAEAASKMKLEALRLKIEIRRRLQVAVRLIETKPDAGDEGVVRTRATLFYNLLCVHGTNIENKGLYDHLFSTFPEYQNLTTCQLAVQLVLNTDYPPPSDRSEQDQWQHDREDANAVLIALDDLAIKHVGFWHAREAKAFEAEIRTVYPKLIQRLKPSK